MQMFFSIYTHRENCRNWFVYMDKSVVLLYILLGGLSRASMSIYWQYPRFFDFSRLQFINFFSPVFCGAAFDGSFFLQKYMIFFRCNSSYWFSLNFRSFLEKWRKPFYCPVIFVRHEMFLALNELNQGLLVVIM